MKLRTALWLSPLILALGSCGYNQIQQLDETASQAKQQISVQLQRRADLVPNLVNTVKGFAAQEKEVLLGVTNARAKVGSVQPSPELINDPGLAIELGTEGRERVRDGHLITLLAENELRLLASFQSA